MMSLIMCVSVFKCVSLFVLCVFVSLSLSLSLSVCVCVCVCVCVPACKHVRVCMCLFVHGRVSVYTCVPEILIYSAVVLFQ